MRTSSFYILLFLCAGSFFCEAFSQTARKGEGKDDQNILVRNVCSVEIGSEEYGYVDLKGNVVIPHGKYAYCFTDTLRFYAAVLTHSNECIGIDSHDRQLFRIYWFDSSPDSPREGLFRIVDESGKLGYANVKGEIVIPPRFAFGFPFEDGVAKVTHTGELKVVPNCNGEYHYWTSDEWFYIDIRGNKVDYNPEE